MADIALLSTTSISPIFPHLAEIYDFVAGVAIEAGQVVYLNTSGKAVISDASAAGTAIVLGVALTKVAANQAVSVMKRGHIAGFDVSAQDNWDQLFLSDTAGMIGDVAGTVSKALGRVTVLSDSPDFSKCIYLDVPWN